MNTLWLDLGNTRLKYWLFQNGVCVQSAAKEHLKAPNELLLGLLAGGNLSGYKLDFVGISSVLGDKINRTLTTTLSDILGDTPFAFAQVAANHRQLSTVYQKTQLGVDRWLQMLGTAAHFADDAPRNCCVVGAGTALTLDVIANGVHIGGYILPNVYMQRHALYAGTQQILVKEGRFDRTDLGQSTFDAVNRGVLFGVTCAVDAFATRYGDYPLILTGGGAALLQPHLANKGEVVADLLLLGLRRYFNQ